MKVLDVKPKKGAGRKAYEAPRMLEAGTFRQNTGFLGINWRESAAPLPRTFW
jgi:hypothetical protein